MKEEIEFVDIFADFIDSVLLLGHEVLFGKLLDGMSFNHIEDELPRSLGITRLVYPVSKLKTTDNLCQYKSLKVSFYSISRFI